MHSSCFFGGLSLHRPSLVILCREGRQRKSGPSSSLYSSLIAAISIRLMVVHTILSGFSVITTQTIWIWPADYLRARKGSSSRSTMPCRGTRAAFDPISSVVNKSITERNYAKLTRLPFPSPRRLLLRFQPVSKEVSKSHGLMFLRE
jgi:hypothetical protein